MKRLILTLTFLSSLAFATTGCDATVTEFVKKAKRADRDVPEQSSSPNGIKFSPGKLEATSADIAAEATVTPTNQLMQGGGISARVGISRTRVR